MSVSLLEVIEHGGYDISTPEDAEWLVSKANEFEELLDQAKETINESEYDNE